MIHGWPAPVLHTFQAAGVRFHQTLKKEPWGARTLSFSIPMGILSCSLHQPIRVRPIGKRGHQTGWLCNRPIMGGSSF